MLSFAVNKDIVTEPPADWADLLKPEFANSVALAGDPRASNQAILGVYAAGLAAGGAAGADAGQKGPGRYKNWGDCSRAATTAETPSAGPGSAVAVYRPIICRVRRWPAAVARPASEGGHEVGHAGLIAHRRIAARQRGQPPLVSGQRGPAASATSRYRAACRLDTL